MANEAIDVKSGFQGIAKVIETGKLDKRRIMFRY